MSYIEPVSLPSAAGVNFGEGDVRHFAEGDGVNVPGLSNPTRHLAARDNMVAEKLNAVIAEVNNKEQIVPLPIYRTVLPPITEEIVANHRIPNGYEARVLNAVISSNPPSSDIELNVLWSEGFGNVSGASVMTTTNESSGGTTFSPYGEFIIQVKNKGGVTLDIVASVMLTMRPITDVSGALLPSATVAPAGPAGAKGEKGEKGDVGSTGPAGSPGLNFRRQWVRLPYPITYQPNDVVTYDFAGTSQRSAFVCLQGHIADGVNQPQPSLMPSPFWDFLSEAGEQGAAGGATVLEQSTNPLTGVFATGSDYVAGVTNGGYTGSGSPSQSYALDFKEVRQQAAGASTGLAHLTASFRRIFAGSVTVTLPTTGGGAIVDWDNSLCHLVVTGNGTIPVSVFKSEGSYANSPVSWDNSSTGWVVNVPGDVPQKVNAAIYGVSAY